MRGIAAILIALATPAAFAAEPPSGKMVFGRFCAECHAPGFGHPGTQPLEWTRGKATSVLELRKDLVPEYVIRVVRNGLVEMPAYRPTEIDDAALIALVQYLAPTKAPVKPKP
jgi:mono/diheme cytochrome c family protein